MVSLNQIVSRIEAIADQHYFVKSFNSGVGSQLLELDQAGDIIYPVVYLEEQPASSTGGAFYFNFNLIIIDLVQDDRSNEREVKSDCLQSAIDFVTTMERFEFISEGNDAFFYPEQTVTYSFVSEQFQDRVSGVQANVSIKQAFDFNRCILPLTGNVNCQAAPSCTDLINSLTTTQLNECILPSYDFSNVTVQGNVTAGQQVDLDAWLCSGGVCVDATVENSDVSYTTGVAAGATLVLPDIDFTDSDGITTQVPSVTDIVATPCASASGINYKPPIYSQYTTFRTGDEGWRIQNNAVDRTPNVYPVSLATLDYTSVTPFLVLAANNAFGNTSRFTNSLGLTVTFDGTNGEEADYFIDHLTGLGWSLVTRTSSNWNNAISDSVALSVNSFSDWYLPTTQEYDTLSNLDLSDTSNYSPLSALSIGATRLWTATTLQVRTVNAYAIFFGQSATIGWNVGSLAKTDTYNYLAVRQHYTT